MSTQAVHVTETQALPQLSVDTAVDAARAFAAGLYYASAERERTPGPRADLLDGLRRAGLYGLPALPAPHAVLGDVVRILATADASLAAILSDHYAAAAAAQAAAHSHQQALISQALRDGGRLSLANGRAIRAGTEDGGTRVEGTADGVISPAGAHWIVLAPFGGRAIAALLDPEATGVAFEAEAPVIGLRGRDTASLVLRDVVLAPGSLLPGSDGPAVGLLLRDFLGASVALGVAEAALRDMSAFVGTRARPWYEADGKPVGEEQAVLYRIGQVAVELRAARVLIARAARLLDDSSREAESAVAEAAGVAGDLALAAASELFAVSGASAADEVHNFSRHWRDARTLTAQSPSLRHFLRAGRFAVRTAPVPEGVNDQRRLVGGGAARRDPPLITSAEEALDVARRYAAAIAVDAAARDRERRYPSQELRLLSESGLLGITVPRDYGGGAAVSLETVVEVLRIISGADSSIGQIPQGQFGVIGSLRKGGTEEQKRFFFAEALRGARFGNASAERFVEHAKVITTRLTRVDGGYRLNGRKYYCTGAPEADWVSVLALDEDDKPLSVLVARGTKGFEVLDDWDSMGQRGTGSGTTLIDDVAVEPIQILPPWFVPGTPSTWAAVANIKHVAAHLGVAEAAFADLAALLRARVQYPAGEAEEAVVLHRLGRLSARVNAGIEMLRDGARHLDRVAALPELTHEAARYASLDITEGKVFIGETAIEIADELFALAGQAALPAALGYDRHWRNARTHTLHDPNRWRYIRAGDYLLNGDLPPANRNN